MIRLATVNGRRVDQPRPYARLADCGGDLWSAYQDAKAAWDRARVSDDPEREQVRRLAIAAHNRWAASADVHPIQSPGTWGFN